MRKVVQKENVDTVDVNNVDPNRYYGVIIPESGRGFVSQDEFRRGKFRTRPLDGITHGNGWGSFEHSDLSELLKGFLSPDRGYAVFEFDTHQELFRWLLEE